jgi:hypothetical protein
MYRYLVLALLLCLPAAALAQPSIAFDNETHDFGVVEQGAVLRHVFEFTNSGTEELVIASLRSS